MENKNFNEECSFTVNKNGIDYICDVLAVIEDKDPIVIYTDYTFDSERKFNLYVSKMIKEDNKYMLVQIDDYSNIPEVSAKLHEIWEENKIEL